MGPRCDSIGTPRGGTPPGLPRLRNRRSEQLSAGSLVHRLRVALTSGRDLSEKVFDLQCIQEGAASPRPLNPPEPSFTAAATVRGGFWEVALGTGGMCHTGCCV